MLSTGFNLLASFLFLFGNEVSGEEMLLVADGANSIIEYTAIAKSSYRRRYVTQTRSPSVPFAIEYDRINDRVIWSDPLKKIIKSVRRNDTESWEIFMGSGTYVEGLAIDAEAGNLYFTERIHGKVGIIKLGPNYIQTLINTGLRAPGDIAIDIAGGSMFITDVLPGRILRADLDGSNLRTLVQLNSNGRPEGLAVDHDDQQLFWVDKDSGVLERVNFDGTGRTKIYSSLGGEFIHVALLGDYLYVTDWNITKLHRVGKDGTDSSLFGEAIHHRGNGIVAYNSLSVTVDSPCSGNYGGCEQLCIPTSQTTHRCACSEGISGTNTCDLTDVSLCSRTFRNGRIGGECSRLASTSCPFFCKRGYTGRVNYLHCQKDGIWFPDADTVCSPYVKDNFLLVSDYWRHKITQIQLETGKSTDLDIPENDLRHPLAIEYDANSQIVYWADRNGAEIGSCNLDGTGLQQLSLPPGSEVEGLAIHAASNTMYYTDYRLELIGKVNLQLTHRQTVTRAGLVNPRGIQVDQYNRYLYVSDWGASARILRVSVKGGSPVTIVRGNLVKPNGLALDFEGEHLYWVDQTLGVLGRCDIHGGDRRTIWKTQPKLTLFGIDIMGSDLFITDWTKRYVHHLKKNGSYVDILGAGMFVSPSGVKIVRENMGTSTATVGVQSTLTPPYITSNNHSLYIGIGIGLLLLLVGTLLIIVLICCCKFRKRPRYSEEAPIPMEAPQTTGHISDAQSQAQCSPPPPYSTTYNMTQHQYESLSYDKKEPLPPEPNQ